MHRTIATHQPKATNHERNRPFRQARDKSQRKSMLITSTILIGSLVTGLGFIIGHDRFYHSLDGHSINSVALSQQWVNRIGTAFAFLVKTSLVAAIVTAYTQRAWRKIQTNVFKLGSIDHLLAAPTNIFSFLHFGVVLRAPDLWLLAIAIWLIPFAAVIAPGSLLVTDAAVISIKNLQVPQLSFNGTAWATRMRFDNNYEYAGASADVQRCALAAATAGSVLSIPHQFPNSSYHLDFRGPAIQCSSANDTIIQANKQAFTGSTGSGGGLTYASWVGNDDHTLVNKNSSTDLSAVYQTLDSQSSDVARIFFASYFGPQSCGGTMDCDFDTIECHLYNASYAVDFNFTNDQMNTTIRSLNLGQPLPALMTKTASGPRSPDWMTGIDGVHVSYQTVMDAFGKIFVGTAYSTGSQNGQPYQTSMTLTDISWSESNKTKRELEEVFQNITISMFSTASLSLNTTQAAYIATTITEYPIVYSYNAQDLWLAYGLSLMMTSIAATFGLYSLVANKVSYSEKFSTVARATKLFGLENMIEEHDNGSDPLPESLRNANIRVREDILLHATEMR